jgi:hypothetical protein
VSFPRRRESRSDTRWIPCQARNNTLYSYYDDTTLARRHRGNFTGCHSRETRPCANGERESRTVLGGLCFVMATKPAGTVSILEFNPLAPNLGGRKRSWGTPPNPRQRGKAPLHAPAGNGNPTIAKDRGCSQPALSAMIDRWIGSNLLKCFPAAPAGNHDATCSGRNLGLDKSCAST